ncbi:MAG TPA: hypothetical protein VFB21_17325, partial [Chthonomonadaceae bacterium]|nr:hypothetical protein [Chthonomonadaceae bacterium]
HYAFSQNAEARIYIRDARGRTLRTLTPTTRAAENGDPNTGSAIWDLRDQRGVVMPSGVYNVELVALSPDGQRSRQIRPYLLSR